MQWFEPLIAIGAIALVVGPIISFFVKKKKGTLKCECGHYMNECTGKCDSCDKANEILDKCRKELDKELKSLS